MAVDAQNLQGRNGCRRSPSLGSALGTKAHPGRSGGAAERGKSDEVKKYLMHGNCSVVQAGAFDLSRLWQLQRGL